MGVRQLIRDAEYVVVEITPLSRGVRAPAVTFVLLVAGLWAMADTWAWPRHHVAWLAAFSLVPCALVLAGRLWRWRSRKIVVTSQRVVMTSGVTKRRVSSIELMDINATHVEQQWTERLRRRGVVLIDTAAGTFITDRVRRPDALCRVLDHQRHQTVRYAEVRLERGAELSKALEDGLLSHEEYDERWRHLFGPDSPRP